MMRRRTSGTSTRRQRGRHDGEQAKRAKWRDALCLL
jgi:hypothetical protein